MHSRHSVFRTGPLLAGLPEPVAVGGGCTLNLSALNGAPLLLGYDGLTAPGRSRTFVLEFVAPDPCLLEDGSVEADDGSRTRDLLVGNQVPCCSATSAFMRRVRVALTGRLTTSDLQSVPALYRDYLRMEADGGVRARDLNLGKVALY